MSIDLKSKTVLWVDNGLFHGFARRVAPEFGRNFYYTPWQSAFPSQKQTRLGEGFPELIRVNYPQMLEDEIDLFVFLDLFQSDWQLRLEKQGKRVWGARLGEQVEIDRSGFRQWAIRNGYQLAAAETIEGADKLRAHLKDKKDVFVKMADGHHRGDMETWKWKSEHLGTPRLDQQIYDLGSFKHDTKFIVENEIKDTIELGEDLFTVDGQWPQYVMQGMEIKGLGTIGVTKPYNQLPQCLQDFNRKIGSIFKQDRSRSFFCMEGLYNRKGQYSPMDPCVRLGSPSNELLQELFTGWGQALWYGAEGILVSPKPMAKYGVVFMAYNENSGKNWQPMKYPPQADRWIKLRNPYTIGSKRYSVPQGSPTNIAGVVGIGNTVSDAAKNAEKNAKLLDGNQLEIATDSIDKMMEVIKKTNQWGAKFN